jgi:hypothetical protein
MPRCSITVFCVAVCLGCSGSPDDAKKKNASGSPSKTDQPLAPKPAARGERGGRIVNLKPDNVKGEIVHDKDAKTIKVFLDAFKPEEVTKIYFVSKVGVAQVEEFPLKKEGASWESKDEKLIARLLEGRSGKVTLHVDTKKSSLLTFEYLTLE